MMRVPAFWLGVAALIGILAADRHWAWAGLILIPITLLFRRKACHGWLIAGMVVFSGGFAGLHQNAIEAVHQFPLKDAISKGAIQVRGKGWIATDANRRSGEMIRVVISVDELTVRRTRVPLPNRDKIVCYIDHPLSGELGYGSEMSFSGRLEPIQPAISPGAFDPAKYFYRSANSIAQISIGPGDICLATGNNRGYLLKRRAIESRQWMEKALLHGVAAEDSEMAGVILAMVLGAREKSPDDLEELFRLSGTMHIFAVSGLHVGVVALLFWSVLKWSGVSRRHAVLIIIPGVLFYALLTGLRPSSFRAAVMLSVFLFGFALRQRPSAINALGIASVILLSFDTQQIFLPGFQLSFCVVLALTLLAPFFSDLFHSPFQIDPFIPRRRIADWRSRLDQVAKGIAGAAGISLASWIGSVLLMSSHFSGISPAGLVANIFMVPIAGAIVVLAGLSISMFGIKLGIVSLVINHLNLFLATVLTILAQFFATLPGAHLHTGGSETSTRDSTMTLDVVGGIRGDQSILATTEKKTWMIDTGGTSTFRGQVLPLLRDRGINRIDCLILSHGDSGHIGGVPYILNHLTPELLIESVQPNRARIYPEIDRIATKRKINRFQVKAGHRLRWDDDTYWEILYPGDSDPPTGLADDRCLVMILRSRGWNILFTFDTGFLIEKSLLLEQINLKSHIWVRGQHSSTNSGSSEFLEAVNPQLIISTKASFPPSERIDEDWTNEVEKQGIRLVTHDEAGSVKIRMTSREMIVKPFREGEEIRIRK